MFDDPGVRSVRVASALCDRFEELLKGPTMVSAHKQSGALVGVAGNEEGLSMRIGEAQAMHPKIRRHLDDARTAFGGRGVDTSAFDCIRAEEGNALGANVDVQHSRHGYGNHAVDARVKSAGFNRAGLVRARQACSALVKATPEIDWAAVEKAESADPAAADFARSARIKRWTRLAALALVIASPFLIVMYMRHREREKRHEYADRYRDETPAPSPPLAPAERDKLATTVSKLQKEIATARAGWPDAAALASVKPSDQPCPNKFTPPAAGAVDSYIRNDTVDAPAFAASDFYGYQAGKPVLDESLARASLAVEALSRSLAKHTTTTADLDHVPTLPATITIAIIDREVEPSITGGDADLAYTAGQVVGHAFMFDVRAAKIVCAGSILMRAPSRAPPLARMSTRHVAIRGACFIARWKKYRNTPGTRDTAARPRTLTHTRRRRYYTHTHTHTHTRWRCYMHSDPPPPRPPPRHSHRRPPVTARSLASPRRVTLRVRFLVGSPDAARGGDGAVRWRRSWVA